MQLQGTVYRRRLPEHCYECGEQRWASLGREFASTIDRWFEKFECGRCGCIERVVDPDPAPELPPTV